jgi:hypothetical protein
LENLSQFYIAFTSWDATQGFQRSLQTTSSSLIAYSHGKHLREMMSLINGAAERIANDRKTGVSPLGMPQNLKKI